MRSMDNKRLREQWVLSLRNRNLSDDTIRNYQKYIKKFDAFMKQKHYSELTPEMTTKFFDSLKLSKTTLNIVSASLRSLYGHLYDRGRIVRDVRLWFPKIKRIRKVLENVPSVNQIRKLILSPDLNTVAGYRDRAMIITQYSGGLRAKELLGLKFGDIDEMGQTITITRKGGAVQEVPVGELAMEYLTTYLHEIRPELQPRSGVESLWVNNWGQASTYDNYRVMLKRHLVNLGLSVSTHALRHSAGTHMLKSGAPLHAISFFLGHKNIESTAIYTKVEPKQIRDVIDKMTL